MLQNTKAGIIKTKAAIGTFFVGRHIIDQHVYSREDFVLPDACREHREGIPTQKGRLS